jgi:urease beta subunit
MTAIRAKHNEGDKPMQTETQFHLVNTNNNEILRDHKGERLTWPASIALEIIEKMPFYAMQKARGQQ